MKKILIIIFCFVSLWLNAATYYVQPLSENANASDANAGTNINYPWATWEHAMQTPVAGDTVYFRGGVYTTSLDGEDAYGYWVYNKIGTKANPICYYAYPGETPILDCSNNDPSTNGGVNRAMRFLNGEYLHFKGLTIRNVLQVDTLQLVNGWDITSPHNVVVENCTMYNIGGVAFIYQLADSLVYLNCDAYNACDTVSHYPGNYGTGFEGYNETDSTTMVYYQGCRAWNCGDQGFGTIDLGYVLYENCWSFSNGLFSGGGHGWKLGFGQATEAYHLQREIRNCIAAANMATGIETNDGGGYMINCNVYNNSVYRTGYKNYVYDEYAYMVYNSGSTTAHETEGRIFRNNVAYMSESADWYAYGGYTQDHNSWTIGMGVSVSAADFVSLDTLELFRPRQSDGSLPDINFMKLVTGSDLIDVGTDVGLAYGGDAPDLGWAEFGDIDSTLTDIITFTLADQTGAATINTTNHTIAIEVAYTADITDLTPTITLSYGATVIPASGVSRDFTSPQTYTVTALDGTTTQEWVVTVTQAEESEEPPTEGTQKMVKFGTAIIRL